ncbi:hypothetical protein ACFS4T_16575 [Pseudomonas lini]
MADPNHPEHEAMLEWHGDSFDPTVFLSVSASIGG